MISGIEMITEAAVMVPNGTSNCVEPVKNAIAAGTVRAFGDGRQRDREQELVPGRDERQDARGGEARCAASGTTTLRNAWKFVAPSTSAASSRSLGISRKNETRM